MSIYSSGGIGGERLAVHSLLTFIIYIRAFGEKHERVLARKLGIENHRPVSLALRAACLLHDVGKACNYYQRDLGARSFPFHEAISSYVVFKVVQNLLSSQGYEDYAELLAYGSGLAVLQHHQAMRSLKEVIEQLTSSYHAARAARSGFHEGLEHEVELALSLLPENERKLLNGLADIVKSVASKVNEDPDPAQIIHSTLNRMIDYMRGIVEHGMSSQAKELRGRLCSLLPLFTVPIQLSDNLAAALIRSRGRLRRLQERTLRLLAD